MDERGGFFPSAPGHGDAFPSFGGNGQGVDDGNGFSVDLTPTEIVPDWPDTPQQDQAGAFPAEETSGQEPAPWGVPVATHGEGDFPAWGAEPTPQSGLDDGFAQTFDSPFGGEAAPQNAWPGSDTQDAGAWGADTGAGSWPQADAWGAEPAPRSGSDAPAEQDFSVHTDTGYGFGAQPYPARENSFAPPDPRTNFEVRLDEPDETRLFEDGPAFGGTAGSWGGSQTWNDSQQPAVPAEPAVSSGEVFPVQPMEEPATDDEMSAEETAAIFAENSGGWKRKTARNSSHDEPAASAAQPASEPPAPPAEEKKSAQPAEEPPMKQQMDNEQPAEKIRPEPEEEPQPPVETAAEEEENPLQHRSVFGRAGSASARAASGGWSAFRKMASEEKSGNPFETGAGGHSFAAAARKAQEQHAAHTFGRHSAGESHTGGSSWQGWGKHQTAEESAPRTSAGVFGRRSGFGTAASRPREEEGILCPACGAKNPAGAKFCCMCRAELRPAENVCPNCGGKVEPGMKFCPFCGKDI